MSEHAVNIIKIEEIKEHPNADALEIIPIGQFQAIVRKDSFKVGDMAVYIEPDYVVPLYRPEFAFLKKGNKATHRLKAIRLRGVISHGLLIPVPHDVKEVYAVFGGVAPGINVIHDLEIKRWEPEQRLVTTGDRIKFEEWPKVGYYGLQKFDVEGMRKAADWFEPGEPVLITEKVHGANARYVVIDNKLYVGSRNQWFKPDGEHIWARMLAIRPDIENWCAAHPGVILYGEIFGRVQSLHYGVKDIDFVAFAALNTNADGDRWINLEELFSSFHAYDLPHVPVLYKGPYSVEAAAAIKERDSVIAQEYRVNGHMMEGVVITPVIERWAGRGGDQRCAVKLISDRYWEFND